MRKISGRTAFLICALIVIVTVGWFFFVGDREPDPDAIWGVTFSEKFAEHIGLDSRLAYTAVLDDLGARHIRLVSHWDLVEPEAGIFSFDDLDWQIREAGKRGADITLAIGMRTPRWPECHIPGWALGVDTKERNRYVLELLEEVVGRYKDDPVIVSWQVENEPFLDFGECPPFDKEFLAEEVSLVRRLDPSRPVLVTDSGEWSLWTRMVPYGDVIGSTLYRRVFFSSIRTYVTYPFSPAFYARRAEVMRLRYGKDVIFVEVQAEPWGNAYTAESILEAQENTMSLEQFRRVIDYARRTGFHEFYLWGAEWWYYLKETQGDARYWEEAKSVLSG